MVLVAGGADHPYAASPLFRVPGTRAALRAGLRAVAPLFAHLAPAARRVLESRALYPLGRAAGALAKEAPREELDHFFKAIGSMDPLAYWGTLRALLEAHAADVLPKLRVPVLVIAPAHDLLAPARDLKKLRTCIPGVRVVDIPGTGHAILLEAGEAVTGPHSTSSCTSCPRLPRRGVERSCRPNRRPPRATSPTSRTHVPSSRRLRHRCSASSRRSTVTRPPRRTTSTTATSVPPAATP